MRAARGKIVTVAIHKGGTGKTTVAAHLAFLGAENGLQTLLVDLDAQANATDTVATGDIPSSSEGRFTVLTASDLFEADYVDRPIYHARPHLDVLPADDRLLAVERLEFEAAESFRARLVALAMSYDLVVMDTPPTLGFAMLAPLLASDFVFAPIVPDAYSIKGIASLVARVQEIRTTSNPALSFLGLLVNKWRRTDRDQNEVVEELRAELGTYLIPYSLLESASIARAAKHRQPVWSGAKSGAQRRAGKAVREALGWVIDKTGAVVA